MASASRKTADPLKIKAIAESSWKRLLQDIKTTVLCLQSVLCICQVEDHMGSEAIWKPYECVAGTLDASPQI